MPYKPYKNEETRSSVLAGIADPANQGAWARFFDAYAGFVFGVARHHGLAEADAHEIVQVVMTELCNGGALAQYDQAKGRFRSWLSRRILWRIADFTNAEDRRRTMEMQVGLDQFHDPADTEEEGDRFEAEWEEAVKGEALRRLEAESNPRTYAVFHASAIDGMDTSSISRMFGVTADNIYQIRRRLGMRLRSLAEDAKRDLDNPDSLQKGPS